MEKAHHLSVIGAVVGVVEFACLACHRHIVVHGRGHKMNLGIVGVPCVGIGAGKGMHGADIKCVEIFEFIYKIGCEGIEFV